jgi:eukaryotic-like serine/threonine-protein kinase
VQVCRHECVLRYYEHWVDGDSHLHIVTEFAAGGDLIDHAHRLKADGKLTMPALLALMVDMAEGLKYVHGKDVWHRDIKPSNVLVDEKGRALLADFGLAREVKSSMVTTATGAGTALYLPPERITAHLGGVSRYDSTADVWALGCTFHGLLLGLPLPFAVDEHGKELRETEHWSPFWRAADGGSSLVANIVHALADWTRLPADTPPDLLALLGEMLAKEPTERPDAVEVAARLALIAKALARRAAAAAPATPTAPLTTSVASTLTSPTTASTRSDGSGKGGVGVTPIHRPPPPPSRLPPGWVMLTDPDSGHPYYWHEASDTTAWERPT